MYGVGAKDTIKQAGREFVELLQQPRMRDVLDKFFWQANGKSLREFETEILNADERALWRAAGNNIDKKYGFSGATFGAMICEDYSILRPDMQPEEETAPGA